MTTFRTNFTKNEQIVHCLVALMYLENTPPEKITRNLMNWKCGTQACFGGHLSSWGYFRDLGVRAATWELPYPVAICRTGARVEPDKVSRALFGSGAMFSFRVRDEPHDISDHELFAWRLERQIERLSKKAARAA